MRGPVRGSIDRGKIMILPPNDTPVTDDENGILFRSIAPLSQSSCSQSGNHQKAAMRYSISNKSKNTASHFHASEDFSTGFKIPDSIEKEQAASRCVCSLSQLFALVIFALLLVVSGKWYDELLEKLTDYKLDTFLNQHDAAMAKAVGSYLSTSQKLVTALVIRADTDFIYSTVCRLANNTRLVSDGYFAHMRSLLHASAFLNPPLCDCPSSLTRIALDIDCGSLSEYTIASTVLIDTFDARNDIESLVATKKPPFSKPAATSQLSSSSSSCSDQKWHALSAYPFLSNTPSSSSEVNSLPSLAGEFYLTFSGLDCAANVSNIRVKASVDLTTCMMSPMLQQSIADIPVNVRTPRVLVSMVFDRDSGYFVASSDYCLGNRLDYHKDKCCSLPSASNLDTASCFSSPSFSYYQNCADPLQAFLLTILYSKQRQGVGFEKESRFLVTSPESVLAFTNPNSTLYQSSDADFILQLSPLFPTIVPQDRSLANYSLPPELIVVSLFVLPDIRSGYEEVLSDLWQDMATNFYLLMTGFVVLCTCISFYVGRHITRRLDELLVAALMIFDNYDINCVKPVHSCVHEMNRMGRILTALNRSLNMFTKFIPPDVVIRIVNDSTWCRLGVVRRHLTILCSDIAGFTGLAERLEPLLLISCLSEYMDAMVTIIQDHEGNVIDFVGDGIMAVFNAPQYVEDHSIAAVTAALKQLAALTVLHVSWKARGMPKLQCRIGLQVGVARAGNMGSNSCMKFGVIGDCVNLASRLEALNKQYDTKLLIGEEVHVDLANSFLCRCIDKVRVVGRTNPTVVYEVLAYKPLNTDGSFCDFLPKAIPTQHVRRESLKHADYQDMDLKPVNKEGTYDELIRRDTNPHRKKSSVFSSSRDLNKLVSPRESLKMGPEKRAPGIITRSKSVFSNLTANKELQKRSSVFERPTSATAPVTALAALFRNPLSPDALNPSPSSHRPVPPLNFHSSYSEKISESCENSDDSDKDEVTQESISRTKTGMQESNEVEMTVKSKNPAVLNAVENSLLDSVEKLLENAKLGKNKATQVMFDSLSSNQVGNIVGVNNKNSPILEIKDVKDKDKGELDLSSVQVVGVGQRRNSSSLLPNRAISQIPLSLRVVGEDHEQGGGESVENNGSPEDNSKILATHEQIQMVSRWYKVIQLYFDGNYIECLSNCVRFMNYYPNDGPGLVIMERSLNFLKNPPPADWDGVYQLDTK